MATLFPIQSRQDSRFFSIQQEDVAVVGSMEGGYDTTRPRTTRTPRKIFTTGFTEITESERVLLQDFFNDVGKYGIVSWTHPITTYVLNVRIVEWPEFKYVGHGIYKAWDFSVVKLKEV